MHKIFINKEEKRIYNNITTGISSNIVFTFNKAISFVEVIMEGELSDERLIYCKEYSAIISSIIHFYFEKHPKNK